jgi:hypothetical protein
MYTLKCCDVTNVLTWEFNRYGRQTTDDGQQLCDDVTNELTWELNRYGRTDDDNGRRRRTTTTHFKSFQSIYNTFLERVSTILHIISSRGLSKWRKGFVVCLSVDDIMCRIRMTSLGVRFAIGCIADSFCNMRLIKSPLFPCHFNVFCCI